MQQFDKFSSLFFLQKEQKKKRNDSPIILEPTITDQLSSKL